MGTSEGADVGTCEGVTVGDCANFADAFFVFFFDVFFFDAFFLAPRSLPLSILTRDDMPSSLEINEGPRK